MIDWLPKGGIVPKSSAASAIFGEDPHHHPRTTLESIRSELARITRPPKVSITAGSYDAFRKTLMDSGAEIVADPGGGATKQFMGIDIIEDDRMPSNVAVLMVDGVVNKFIYLDAEAKP